ncbi:hypothetical protein [Nitrosophilus alvini]|uniref:hypothetical protein n=1 Tax=Nitrosophilus alvini TaxID=2714855 RepID=UPI00190D10D5|nr:hypothetical protein [Nitrosophilus alvini]
MSILCLKNRAGFFIPFLFLFLFGSSLYANSDVEEIKNTVISYNNLLIKAAKNRDFIKNFDNKKIFEKEATPKVAQKLYIWIASWQENNLYMDATLLKIEFENINTQGSNAEALTDEIWRYRYFSYTPEGGIKEAYPPSKMYYKVKYTLTKDNGKWKIENIKVLSEKEERLKKD